MGWGLLFSALLAQAQSLLFRLSEAGIFSNLERLEISEGLPYEINVPFWSDGAQKRRWIVLPPGGRIGFQKTDSWDLPIGTKLIKHFDLPGADGLFRVETRVLVREESGWRGYSYKWNRKQTDAELVEDGADERYLVGGRTQLWHFPSRYECLFCHQPNAGSALGIRTVQLNRIVGNQNQIRAWSERGWFTSPVNCTAHLPRLTDPWDEKEPLELRARSYLDVNCATCHRAGGSGPMELRFDTPLAETQTIRVPVTGTDPEDPHAVRIVPGDPERSALWRRVSSVEAIMMPPLGRSLVDPRGSQLLSDWIRALK